MAYKLLLPSQKPRFSSDNLHASVIVHSYYTNACWTRSHASSIWII